MGFESGSASFRMFYVPRPLPADAVERFAKTALPPLDLLGRNVLRGWTGGRHLLDRTINDDNAFLAGYLRLNLVKAERRIPNALLRAECKIEELALMQAEGKAFLTRGERSKIRKEVEERLLPTMPPTLTGLPIVYDGEQRMLYAGALSDKQTDALLLNFAAATEIGLVPVDTASAAMKRARLDVASLEPVSFSPELEDALAAPQIGLDFLTWLWFHAEARGGMLDDDGESCAVMVEGPLALFLEGDGAHLAVLRNGAPLFSSEAKTALLGGKKLRSAKLTLSRAREIWSVSFDAASFAFRGFKFPQSEERLDAVSAFQQRMLSLARFAQTLFAFYDAFLAVRGDAARWKKEQKEIWPWVTDRTTKT